MTKWNTGLGRSQEHVNPKDASYATWIVAPLPQSAQMLVHLTPCLYGTGLSLEPQAELRGNTQHRLSGMPRREQSTKGSLQGPKNLSNRYYQTEILRKELDKEWTATCFFKMQSISTLSQLPPSVLLPIPGREHIPTQLWLGRAAKKRIWRICNLLQFSFTKIIHWLE